MEIEIENIRENGAMSQLNRYKEETGIEPTENMIHLANIRDDLEITLEQIQHSYFLEKNPSEVIRAINSLSSKVKEVFDFNFFKK